MGLRIRTNMASVNAQRNLERSTGSLQQDMEKLASGYRINKAADDAAGLAISEKMKGRIRSLGQAQRNANDGISLVQVAEGSMNEMSNILTRMRELATQSASDTVGNLERTFTNREYTQLTDEIDRIAKTTEFNGRPLLQGADAIGASDFTLHVGAGDGTIENTDTIKLPIEVMKIDAAETLGLGRTSEIGPEEIGGDFSRETAAEKLTVIDRALESLANNRAYLGSSQNRLTSTVNNLGIQIENMKGAHSRVKDVDFAEASANFTQDRIIQQGGVSVLAQANNAPELALQLLR